MDDIRVISQSIVYIENHLYAPITACDVAKAVSYSYYHFHRYFLSVIGETIGSYIRNRRLAQAAWQLVYSSQKILDIGISLYFESAESFTRAFKNRYGISPMAYRKNGIYTTIGNRNAQTQPEHFLPKEFLLEPEIITIQSISLLGRRFYTRVDGNESVALWQTLKDGIPSNLCSNNRYEVFETTEACQSNSFEIDQSISIFLGIEAREVNATKLQRKTIYPGKYAKFTHIGSIHSLIYTYEYIWSVWFPKSSFQLGSHEDFECYTDRFLGTENQNSQVDIYFPIK